MDETRSRQSEVDQFIIEEIEGVPHLEALLLLWNTRPRQWSFQEMSQALYLTPEQTQPILQDLVQRRLVLLVSDSYSYNQDHPKNAVIELLDKMYRKEVVRISTMIHSKPSASVRAFARAFKLHKD
jgi:hypothetical protein